MCRFKSGIIFKGRSVVAPGENDSHSDLLEELGVEDTQANAMTKFVRAELLPPNDEWWTDPDNWKMHVDQDIVPDWFSLDREKYEQEFREAVKAWWNKHVLVDRKIEELNSGYYRLKRCDVKRLCNDVRVLLDESQVGVMRGSSQVGEMWGSSTARDFKDYPKIKIMIPEDGNFELVRKPKEDKRDE